MTTATSFSSWLLVELEERGWSQSELARRAGMSKGQISHVIIGTRAAGLDTYEGIARAFRLPLEEVLRHAGVLPPITDDDPTIAAINSRLGVLPSELRQNIIEHIQDLLDLLQPLAIPSIAEEEELIETPNRLTGTKFETRPPRDRDELIELLELFDDDELQQYSDAMRFAINAGYFDETEESESVEKLTG